MGRRPWRTGLAIGAVAGLLVAAVMTFLDWRRNPADLFHGPRGTDWSVVAETAASWLWPVALAVAAVAVVLLQRPGRKP